MSFTVEPESNNGMNQSKLRRQACVVAAKTTLYFLNWTFLIGSSMTLVLGLYVYWKFKVMQSLLDTNFNPDIYISILSLLLFLLGCLGYFAVIRERPCLLGWYLVALMVLMLLYIPLGWVTYKVPLESFKNEKGAKKVWIALHNYYERDTSKKLMDEIQDMLECCGISEEGYKDWNLNLHSKCNESNSRPSKCTVPLSCCKVKDKKPVPVCGSYFLNDTDISQSEVGKTIHTRGCLSVIIHSMERAAYTIGFFAYATAFVVIMSFTLTLVLLKCGGEKRRQQRIQNVLMGSRTEDLNYTDVNLAVPRQNIAPEPRPYLEDVFFIF